MASSVDWRDIKYEEVFEQEIRGLLRRRESDPTCTVADLEGVLQHLYHMDGADWTGRGEVQDITMAATIAAYEHIIAQWKAEK
ncbi:hypothetical protein LQZ21_02300 [Treponema sp. TIM-1]|uniref:hypothetical protein n=1 Tax=Treponema sp. TIM-1 TaxID=2898417 RepID=UPI00397FACC5